MRSYGYARISTNKQNIERQVRNILTVQPDAIIVREIYTGTKFQGRKELQKILAKVNAGDKIIFDSVSRMSRTAEEGFAEYEKLFHAGVILEFIREPYINTEVYRQTIENPVCLPASTGDEAADELMEAMTEALNRYVMALARRQIQLAFEQAEKEVADLHRRTREGMETARLNGKQIGLERGRKLVTKKSLEAKEKIRKYNKDFNGTLTNEETWKLAGISKMTFYKYKREMISE